MILALFNFLSFLKFHFNDLILANFAVKSTYKELTIFYIYFLDTLTDNFLHSDSETIIF